MLDKGLLQGSRKPDVSLHVDEGQMSVVDIVKLQSVNQVINQMVPALCWVCVV